jgi:hypothetical protein
MMHSVSNKITAVEVQNGCPPVLQDIAQQINAHWEKARKCEAKADQHYTAIAQYLAQAQAACDEGGFTAFREKFCPNLGQSRAYELLSIATKEKSIEDVRASTRARVARHRANKAKASVTVTETHDHVTRPQDVAQADSFEANSAAPTQEVDRRQRAYTPSDEALFGFSAQFLELQRRIARQQVERFARTSIPAHDLARVGEFLTDLAQLKRSRTKPTLVEECDPPAKSSADEPAENLKASREAFEQPSDLAA